MAWTERYVDANATGLGGGASAGDPWTISQAVSLGALSGPMRINVKAGSYDVSFGLNASWSGNSGANRVWYRGYKTTPGDLHGVDILTQTAGTDCPLIFTQASSVIVNFDEASTILSDMQFESESARIVVGSSGLLMNCKFTRSLAATSDIFQIGGNSNVVACQFNGVSTSSDGLLKVVGSADIYGCEFTLSSSNSGDRMIETSVGTSVRDCLFSSDGNGIAVYGRPALVENCTFYNLEGAVFLDSTDSNSVFSSIQNILHTVGTGYETSVTGTSGATLIGNVNYLVTTKVDSSMTDVIELNEQTSSTDPIDVSGGFALTSTSDGLASNVNLPFGLMENIDSGAFQSAPSSGGGGGGGGTTTISLHPLDA